MPSPGSVELSRTFPMAEKHTWGLWGWSVTGWRPLCLLHTRADHLLYTQPLAGEGQARTFPCSLPQVGTEAEGGCELC